MPILHNHHRGKHGMAKDRNQDGAVDGSLDDAEPQGQAPRLLATR
jgi:hypothetical protein